MTQDADAFGHEIAALRGYLHVLARMHLDRKLWRKVDPDDIVSATLQDAVEKRQQYSGEGPEQLRAWLRAMVLHNVFDAIRFLRRQKRDADLEADLERSSVRLIDSLAAEQSSPSERAAKNETLSHLADALAKLPVDQQEAVILHHLHERTLAETAEHMGRSPVAVAGLIHRGLMRLRELLEPGA
jgi:RNA polymerase sigma-70 factor (ECF subfamily)